MNIPNPIMTASSPVIQLSFRAVSPKCSSFRSAVTDAMKLPFARQPRRRPAYRLACPEKEIAVLIRSAHHRDLKCWVSQGISTNEGTDGHLPMILNSPANLGFHLASWPWNPLRHVFHACGQIFQEFRVTMQPATTMLALIGFRG